MPPPTALQQTKPNIILILTDDLDRHSIEFMPRVKSLLIDQGLTFQHAFVTSPICCPSRASFLTGKYPHNHGVLTNRAPQGGFKKFHETGQEGATVATWLKDAGYRTALFGKYLNSYPTNDPTYIPPGWDEWVAYLYHEQYFGYRLNDNGRVVSAGSKPEDYITDVLTERTLDFIDRASRDRAPFFLYLSHYAPHEPATPAPRHTAAFPDARAPRFPSFNEDDVSDKPGWVRNQSRLSSRQIQQIDDLYRKRLQSLLSVDEMVERLVETLLSANLMNNTYIFFTSDNGYHFGEHRLANEKGTPYEESIRIPLIVVGPGVPQGATLDHLVLNIDFGPTFVDLAGADQFNQVDGRSFAPLLTVDPPAPELWRQDFLIEYWPLYPWDPPRYSAHRSTGSLYVEYATGEREFYDLTEDPFELQNLIAEVKQSFIDPFARRLEQLRKCSAANCRE